MPKEKEFDTMEKYAIVMKPLVEITETIGTVRWVTILISFKNIIHSDQQNHYVDESLVFLTKAAFLDPRFKMLSFLDSLERDDVIS